jgi:hypothetical protein
LELHKDALHAYFAHKGSRFQYLLPYVQWHLIADETMLPFLH